MLASQDDDMPATEHISKCENNQESEENKTNISVSVDPAHKCVISNVVNNALDIVSDESNAKEIVHIQLDSEPCENYNSEKCVSVNLESPAGSHDISQPFKKPLLLGSKGKSSRVLSGESSQGVRVASEHYKGEEKKHPSSALSVQKREGLVLTSYKEPSWSSTLAEPYALEVLKSGSIIETIDLSSKPFFVFGRQSNCDVQLGHPTVSRHHAVLQQRAKSDTSKEDVWSTCKSTGIYIYDLGSTHGTFVNKQLIPKQKYIRLYVGHIVKFGGSTRSYIVMGPQSDTEAESEKSVTELKQEAFLRQLAREDVLAADAERTKEEEDQGVDWGLGEDADEETDLSENPFAATQNEELYLDDPKKTLRGWFEREGEELEYEVEEKGFGQFLCQVRLPVDDTRGKPMVAEALVKGKKKEAVVQCALEACRILDRLGLLRQATHESKKRKAKNWEEDDFYSSDEDTFLDRTGTVERKREKRMRTAGKLKTKTETHESLLDKHQEVLKKLQDVQAALDAERTGKLINFKEKKSGQDETDTLDAFMSTLTNKTSLDKVNFRRLKVDLADLQQQEVHLNKLIKMTRPVSLPGLKSTVFPGKSSQEDQDSKEIESMSTCRPSDCSSSHPSGNPEPISEENVKALDDTRKTDKLSDEESFLEIAAIHEQCIKSAGSKIEDVSNEAGVVDKVETSGETYPPMLRGEESTFKESLQIHKKYESRRKNAKQMNKNPVVEEDYSMWVPPENQTGDGKTELNEKYGY